MHNCCSGRNVKQYATSNDIWELPANYVKGARREEGPQRLFPGDCHQGEEVEGGERRRRRRGLDGRAAFGEQLETLAAAGDGVVATAVVLRLHEASKGLSTLATASMVFHDE